DLADVMELRGDAELLDLFGSAPHLRSQKDGVASYAIGVTASVRILFVDRSGEHLDRVQEERFVLLGGALQIMHEALEVVRHGIECLRQLADFGAALEVNTFGEIATRDGSARFGQGLKWGSDQTRGVDTEAEAERDSQRSKEFGGALHLKHAAIGFVLGF